ncbi:MAG: orotidine 5'-phosphate decarboxylase / HUMPS family protein [Candidatus Bathyarchaeia archaeon]
MFRLNKGLVVACDVDDLGLLERLVDATRDLEPIQGYKIGAGLALRYGIGRAAGIIRKRSDLPIIYDHQKFGTDIPEVCGRLLGALRDSGIDSVIIFPQAGIETLKASVKACAEEGLIPMVGGEMTHKGYLSSEGGYIEDRGPERIYLDAAAMGVEYFILPGNRPASMERYRDLLSGAVARPKFLFPGVGVGQGGDVARAFSILRGHPAYAIVGRGIYSRPDAGRAALEIWDWIRSEGA